MRPSGGTTLGIKSTEAMATDTDGGSRVAAQHPYEELIVGVPHPHSCKLLRSLLKHSINIGQIKT